MTERTPTFSLAELSDRAEILEMYSRYCHGMDGRNIDVYLGVFHEDAVKDMAEMEAYTGHDKIRQYCDIVWDLFEATLHLIGNIVIKLEGDRAIVRADVFAISSKNGQEYFSTASYDDIVERRNGGWKILRRTTTLHNVPTIATSPEMKAKAAQIVGKA